MNSASHILLTWLQEQCDIDYDTDKLRTCKHLDLSGCGITELPKEIELFSNLISIDLSNNVLESLPDTIGNISSLVNVNLRRNAFTHIPKVLTSLPIKSLNMSANKLINIESLCFMDSVRVLDLSANQISDISKAFDSMHYLRVLNLAFNYLDSLHFITPALLELERLTLSDNLLKSIDSNVALLENLQYLDISNNAIARVDKSLFDLDIETLEAYDNDIKTVHFENLELLGVLNLDNNPIKELSFAPLSMPILEELSLEGCTLVDLQLPNTTMLHTLNLSSNKLVAIPSAIYHCKQLIELDLSDNKIIDVNVDALAALPLKTLYIEDNPIPEVSEKELLAMQIEYLDVREHSIIVEFAKFEDIDKMAHLLSQLFSIERDFGVDYAKQKEGLELVFNDEMSDILVARVDNALVAMATMQRLISTAEGGYVGHIEDVVVDDEYRNRGIGTYLVERLVALAKERGYKRLQLAADRENTKALLFYQKRSFSATSLSIYRNRTFS